MASSRLALLVSSTSYEDSSLEELRLPEDHVDELTRALKRETCGRYQVELLRNKPAQVVLRCVNKLLQSAEPDDVVVIYFHGHTIVNSDGELHVAMRDTRLESLRDSSLVLSMLAGALDAGGCQNQIVIMDCHHALATHDVPAPEGMSVGVEDQLQGDGTRRILMANSDSLHNVVGVGALDGLETAGSYTSLIVDALRRGKADKDRDGLITIDECVAHVHAASGSPMGLHAPVKRVFDEARGDVLFAFARGGKASTCFVVLPMSGAEGERAAEVVEQYIEPACKLAGFRPVNSQVETTPEIVSEIYQTLRTAPMVLAYLGESPWNPIVMMEVGYRLATRLPIVLLREQEGDETDAQLPFDIKGRRVIELMDRGEAVERPELIKKNYVKQIAQLLLDTANHNPWESPHPVAVMTLNRDTGEGSFVESSPAADLLFDAEDGLQGMSLSLLITKLEDMMPSDQFAAFSEDQDQLVLQLLVPTTGFMGKRPVSVPRAKWPIVFTKHNLAPEQFVNRSFLPIIVEYSRQGSELQLKLLYLDVTNVTVEETRDERRLYRCTLESPRDSGNGQTQPLGRQPEHHDLRSSSGS